MMESATYLVTQEIAQRSGLIDSRYRIADGRFMLNDRDLARIRFTPDEYINGLQGIERTTSEEAQTLIARNGYSLGPATEAPEEETVEPGEIEESGGNGGSEDTEETGGNGDIEETETT